MRVTFLNTWGGRELNSLLRFVQESASDTDFFCFQEIFDSPIATTVSWGGHSNILSELSQALPDFHPYFAPVIERWDGDQRVDFELRLGLAIFGKKEIPIVSHGDFIISGRVNPEEMRPGSFPHNLQYVRFEAGGKPYTIATLHGIAHPGSKLDTPERLAQSEKIVEFLKGEKGAVVLGGDFNLLPETESIRMLEAAPVRNLIKEFDVRDTRGAISHARFPESPQCFADYVFVSSEVNVVHFAVPPVAVSDHLPLILEFT